MKQLLLSPSKHAGIPTISVPGSKSITNRALLLAALTKNAVLIKNPLISDDTEAMIACLKTLGIKIQKSGNDILVVGNIDDIKNNSYILDCKLSGLTLRFLIALSCITAGEKILTGEEGLKKRPIKDLVDSLTLAGAQITYLEKEGFPPIKITSEKITSKTIAVSGKISSQFLSALLLIAPIAHIKFFVKDELISRSYVELTKEVMQLFGVSVVENTSTFSVEGTYTAKDFIVEGDFSSACYFATVAALTKSTIILKNLHPHSAQGDKEFLTILSLMGNEMKETKTGIIISGKGVKPVSVDMTNCPDQIQTLAVLAAFAKGETKILGISSLRVKETDRIAALVTELKKMGIQVDIKANTMIIHGGKPHSATIDTYNDHRMAMAFAVAGTQLSGMRINNPDVVTKTFPNFWKEFKKVGVEIKERKVRKDKIVLTGFMGAGKTSIAPLLAKKIGSSVVEMDYLVLKKSKKKSIKEIFETQGEEIFRKLEHDVAKSLKNKTDLIISAGGGVITNSRTIDALTHNATVIFLSTTFETIKKRLVDTSNRPLWTDFSQTKKLFELRKPLYEQHADITVSTDGKSLGMITNEIMEKLEEII